ncbi:hypothetical protein GCM10022408_20500 [Hymenobacter fastidiosus]|uniref:Uncharacterized protein n=1 Tax=Hymenobacter fastidiosus TaxID=486264 RepID=A0ABP7S9I0_9BACT
MIVKGEYGFVPGLCAAIMAAGIAFLLIGATKAKSDKTKLVALVGSVIVIVSFMVLIVEREVPIEPSEQTTQAE